MSEVRLKERLWLMVRDGEFTVYTDTLSGQSETKGLQDKHFPHTWTVATIVTQTLKYF